MSATSNARAAACLILLGACSGGRSSSPAPAPAKTSAPTAAEAVAQPGPDPEAVAAVSVERCTTRAEAQARLGQSCAVVGSYELKAFSGKGKKSLGDWPIVRLGDDSEVMIESIWDQTKKPDAELVERHRGRRVEVVGKLHGAPPRSMPANFAFLCVSPVDSMRLVTE